MPDFKFVCLVNSREGADDAFNDWHSGTHMPEVVAHGGFARAQRLRLVTPLPGNQGTYQYLILYEGWAEDSRDALAGLNRAVAEHRVTFSDALDPVSWAAVYEEIPGATYPAVGAGPTEKDQTDADA